MITLVVNATVLTMDPTLPVAEALAVKDGRLVEVGGTDEILWLREDDYELIDLEGRTVVPGFVDPHNHFSIGALETFWADCRDATSIADLQSAMAAAAARTPPGEWVRGLGYDARRLRERRDPTRAELDEAVADRPALLLHFSHHQGVANSRALAAAGVTRATPDPRGGEIGRDRSGEPTGLLYERAMSDAERGSREGWETRFVASAAAASRAYAAQGITTIQDAAVTPAMARRYAQAREAGALAIDVVETMVGSRGWFDPPDDAAPGPWLKLFVDGGYRCAVRFERDGRLVTQGFLFYERGELAAILTSAWRAGRRVVCHAIGNVGLETAAGAIADALAGEPAGRERVRIDHAIFLTPELIGRIADLGVWVVAQPSFLWDGVTSAPPPGLMRRPFRSVVEAGISQAFSSDFPCGSLSPLAGIAAAVGRRTRHGELADADQAISIRQALEAYTIGAARAAGLGHDRGSLEAGKRADFLVLSTNPLQSQPHELAEVQVLQTWVSGKLVTNKA
ncbi:MAG: amidohydrolase [Candidatus Rokubacteria bacterium]|nr:amidohydrolase [Candidatus Rokubacteria bacterium]MBI3826614.1 amidohydrolase [Candidatus Rokubacteria bacterium]